MWDDTLMMTVIPLAKIGLLLNRPAYIEEAKYQFLIHIQYLMDTKSGLWFHGWQFTPEGGHNFANALWARGNCWITVAIPLFIEILGDHHLPASDPIRRILESTLTRQIDALVETQDKATGLWHTLLVDPSSYLESSATAGFAAGIYMALRMVSASPSSSFPSLRTHGLTDRISSLIQFMPILSFPQGLIQGGQYRNCADTALAGVLGNIQPDGEVAQVSFGTGMGSDLDFYKKIPITSMPYGQALAMLALVEWERLEVTTKK